MAVTVCVLVLLDRVVACSATGKDADKWSRNQLCQTGTDFNNKLVLMGSSRLPGMLGSVPTAAEAPEIKPSLNPRACFVPLAAAASLLGQVCL